MEPNGGPIIAVAINLVCLNMDLRLKKEFSQITKLQTNEIELKKAVKLVFDAACHDDRSAYIDWRSVRYNKKSKQTLHEKK